MARATTLSPDVHDKPTAELGPLLDEKDDPESHARAVRRAFCGPGRPKKPKHAAQPAEEG